MNNAYLDINICTVSQYTCMNELCCSSPESQRQHTTVRHLLTYNITWWTWCSSCVTISKGYNNIQVSITTVVMIIYEMIHVKRTLKGFLENVTKKFIKKQFILMHFVSYMMDICMNLNVHPKYLILFSFNQLLTN